MHTTSIFQWNCFWSNPSLHHTFCILLDSHTPNSFPVGKISTILCCCWENNYCSRHTLGTKLMTGIADSCPLHTLHTTLKIHSRNTLLMYRTLDTEKYCMRDSCYLSTFWCWSRLWPIQTSQPGDMCCRRWICGSISQEQLIQRSCCLEWCSCRSGWTHGRR